MDNWERSDETSLPDKESFYSSLNMENIDDIDYNHANSVFKNLKTLEICALKCTSSILLISYHYQD